jgi:hypothetical protein
MRLELRGALVQSGEQRSVDRILAASFFRTRPPRPPEPGAPTVDLADRRRRRLHEAQQQQQDEGR